MDEQLRQAALDFHQFPQPGKIQVSPTKPLAPTAPHSLLGRAKRELGVPVACIGGITLANAAGCTLSTAGSPLAPTGSDKLLTHYRTSHAAADFDLRCPRR